MKHLYILIGIAGILLVMSCTTPSNPQTEKKDMNPSPKEETTGYDAGLAEKLGADKYGMRQYVMAFLKSGPNQNQDKETANALQRAHLDNIHRLAAEGKLLLAGPFMTDGDLRGVYIFDVATVAEAKALTETDPAIKAGRLVMELHPWYGSAALKQVNDIHTRIAQENP